jgi:Tn3 transposase DDE domain
MASGANCYQEGQEDQLGALGLVVNIIVLWNTLCIDAVTLYSNPGITLVYYQSNKLDRFRDLNAAKQPCRTYSGI